MMKTIAAAALLLVGSIGAKSKRPRLTVAAVLTVGILVIGATKYRWPVLR